MNLTDELLTAHDRLLSADENFREILRDANYVYLDKQNYWVHPDYVSSFETLPVDSLPEGTLFEEAKGRIIRIR